MCRQQRYGESGMRRSAKVRIDPAIEKVSRRFGRLREAMMRSAVTIGISGAIRSLQEMTVFMHIPLTAN